MTSWPFPEFVKHAWPGAWVCSCFRNESQLLASELIRQAVAATRYLWQEVPEQGMVSFVNAKKVRHKRDPGRCFVKAGFKHVGYTAGGLLAFVLPRSSIPDPIAPMGPGDSLFSGLQLCETAGGYGSKPIGLEAADV